MEKQSLITKSNLLVIQLLAWIDNGCTGGIGVMTAEVSSSGLAQYLKNTYDADLTVDNDEYFEIVTKNLINFWNVTDNEEYEIKNNGLVYLVFSLLELNRSDYREDL